MPGLRLTRNILGGAALAFIVSACATVPRAAPAGTLALGNNASGERCTATANWTDPALRNFVKNPDVYSVNCTGAVTDALARVRMFPSGAARSAASADLKCGAASDVALAGFDRASARRCFDPALGFATVVVDADKAGTAVQISAAANALGAGYQAALLLVGQPAGDGEVTSARTPIDLASLAALPSGYADAQAATGPRETPETLLARATEFNFRGLSADASRFLRNELSRLPADTPGKVRAQLLLEAGLADSNIRFFRSAAINLGAAEAVIRSLDSVDQRTLRPKLATYRGLHALNQRDFAEARKILEPLAKRSTERVANLSDPATLVQLNTVVSDKSDIRSAIAVPDLELARETIIGVQGNWALSVAQLALGNRSGALDAIEKSSGELSALRTSLEGQRIRQDGLYWLDARLQRQRGRVQAESGDFTAALKSFDEAIAKLSSGGRARTLGAGDPVVAELQLERASIIGRSGQPKANVQKAYEEAIAAMLAAREASAGLSTGLLHPYLDDLAGRMVGGEKAAATSYFAALQVAGESSAARQVSQLQEIVSEDPAIATKLRERQDLRRRLSDLTASIADARTRGEPLTELEAERARAQAAFSDVDADLAADTRLSQVSDRPADLAALQATLKPGEGYLRLTVMNDRVFGILIDRDAAYPIRPRLGSEDLLAIATTLRRSADYDIETGKIGGFNLDAASILYQALLGDLDSQLAGKTELVVDGGRLFSNMTAGLLITDRESLRAFRKQRDKSDYSQIAFLAKKMPTSVAMSPRSFIASRGFAPTRARQALYGFAAPVGLGEQKVGTDGKFRVGPCLVDADRFTRSINRLDPISDREIYLVAEALGVSGAPSLLTGAAFSDTEMQRRGAASGDLADYKVLHFATHGVTEGMFDCSDFPAGLLTSFGGTSTSDLMLSYDEIAALRLDANLVVMSACETASLIGEANQLRAGEAQPGSTLDGLVRSFFAAGSRAVLATFWETSNAGKSEAFMTAFYSAGRDQSIVQSINQAQQVLLADPVTSHPFYWAGFFVVGDTDNKMLDGPGKTVARR